MKLKYVFVGDLNSINLEIINKSHNYIKNKVKYILIGNIKDIIKYLIKIKSEIKVNEIIDPIEFKNYDKNFLNIFNINNKSRYKYKNLINQINISNQLSKITNRDLVTMPIDKSIFKKKMDFIGMTEYLGKINNKKTYMLMYGNKFSIIPFTTHINPKKISKYIKDYKIREFLLNSLDLIKDNNYSLNFREIRFLCYNPHCGENGMLGNEDIIIHKEIKKIKQISGTIPADSAFNKLSKGILFLSTYHDQALIPFKILNQKSFNMTLGLNYRRLSPSHGTAKNIKFKNFSDNKSFIKCMKF